MQIREQTTMEDQRPISSLDLPNVFYACFTLNYHVQSVPTLDFYWLYKAHEDLTSKSCVGNNF